MDGPAQGQTRWQLSLREGMVLLVALAGALALWRNEARWWSQDDWIDFAIRFVIVLPAVAMLVVLWVRSGHEPPGPRGPWSSHDGRR